MYADYESGDQVKDWPPKVAQPIFRHMKDLHKSEMVEHHISIFKSEKKKYLY